MADAILTQRLLIGAAALAGLFLVVLVLIAGFALVAMAVNRYREADAQVEQIIAETLAEPATPELAAGCDRLRAAIRDEQQKGEQV